GVRPPFVANHFRATLRGQTPVCCEPLRGHACCGLRGAQRFGVRPRLVADPGLLRTASPGFLRTASVARLDERDVEVVGVAEVGVAPFAAAAEVDRDRLALRLGAEVAQAGEPPLQVRDADRELERAGVAPRAAAV